MIETHTEKQASRTQTSAKNFEDIKKNSTTAEKELSILPLSTRLKWITNLKNTILDRQEEIIDRVQAETNKSRMDALVSEIFGTLDHLAFLEKFAIRALEDERVYTPMALMGKKSKVVYDPLGTVLVVAPWNYPFYQAIVPITSAFMAGNAVVFKPSEHTPLEGLIESLLADSGFAPSWVQVVYGDGKVGSQLIDLKPDLIFFTGSTSTGRKILSQASQSLTPVILELGGKDPMVVFEDVNIDRASEGALWGMLTNSGQACTSVETVHIHEKIYDEFSSQLKSKLDSVKQQVDKDGDADIGGMTAKFQHEIVTRHLKNAKELGASVYTGKSAGNTGDIDLDWDRSALIRPTILENTNKTMSCEQGEIFGPTVILKKFSSEEDVIEEINQSEFGLSASVWSADLKRAERVARQIETGNVSINNVMLTEGNPALPFGGVKNSGYGRYKGELGLRSFCNIKSIIIDRNSSKHEANWFPYTKEKYKVFSDLVQHAFRGGIGSFAKFALTGLKLESLAAKLQKKRR